jgi:phage FluMu gp28-like protein
LYDKQRAAIFCDSRYAFIEATSKGGKTFGCIVWLAEQAMRGRSWQNFWWVAPVYAQAKIAFRRLKRGLPRETFTANESEMTITLANGAIIWFKSGDHPDTLYGEDVFAAVMDEASRIVEDSWHALRSTLTATKGPVRCIGNVKGRKNWFYKLCRKAESGAAGMMFSKLTWRDAVAGGIMEKSEVDDARAVLPERVFKELFEAEASDDAGNPFGFAAITSCIIPTLSKLPPVCWGIDLAKSYDWTVLTGLDINGALCRLHRFQMPWQDTIKRIKAEVGHCRALVDSTGVGDPILEALQTNGGSNFKGLVFTSASKQKIMEGLAVAIQSKLISYPDGVVVTELEAFEFQYAARGVRYSAPDGSNDDVVCSLALAWEEFTTKQARLGAVLI